MSTTPQPFANEAMIVIQPQREPLSVASWVGIVLGVIGGALLLVSSHLPWWTHTQLVTGCGITPGLESVTITGGQIPLLIGGGVVALSLAQFSYHRWPSIARSSFTLCVLLVTGSMMAFNVVATAYTWQVGWYVACGGVLLGLVGASVQFMAAQPRTVIGTAPREWQRRAVGSLSLALATLLAVIGTVTFLGLTQPNQTSLAVVVITGFAGIVVAASAAFMGYSTLQDEPGVMLSRPLRRMAAFGASFALSQLVLYVGTYFFVASQFHSFVCL